MQCFTDSRTLKISRQWKYCHDKIIHKFRRCLDIIILIDKLSFCDTEYEKKKKGNFNEGEGQTHTEKRGWGEGLGMSIFPEKGYLPLPPPPLTLTHPTSPTVNMSSVLLQNEGHLVKDTDYQWKLDAGLKRLSPHSATGHLEK